MQDRIHRHQRELLAFLHRRAPADAEELAQETWIRVATASPDCPDDASFRAYAYTVARRLLIDHYRKRSNRVHFVPLDGLRNLTASEHPADRMAAAKILSVVELELDAMKPEIAEVFRWRMTEDISFKEIAVRQDVPLNTALGRMHRAVQRLRGALIAEGVLPNAA